MIAPCGYIVLSYFSDTLLFKAAKLDCNMLTVVWFAGHLCYNSNQWMPVVHFEGLLSLQLDLLIRGQYIHIKARWEMTTITKTNEHIQQFAEHLCDSIIYSTLFAHQALANHWYHAYGTPRGALTVTLNISLWDHSIWVNSFPLCFFHTICVHLCEFIALQFHCKWQTGVRTICVVVVFMFLCFCLSMFMFFHFFLVSVHLYFAC